MDSRKLMILCFLALFFLSSIRSDEGPDTIKSQTIDEEDVGQSENDGGETREPPIMTEEGHDESENDSRDIEIPQTIAKDYSKDFENVRELFNKAISASFDPGASSKCFCDYPKKEILRLTTGNCVLTEGALHIPSQCVSFKIPIRKFMNPICPSVSWFAINRPIPSPGYKCSAIYPIEETNCSTTLPCRYSNGDKPLSLGCSSNCTQRYADEYICSFCVKDGTNIYSFQLIKVPIPKSCECITRCNTFENL